jgi:uncharacterized protein YlxW (UPF0749 family)
MRLAPRSAPAGVIRRSRWWRGGVPLVALLAGMLFAVSAATANGTDLRSEQGGDLRQVIDSNSTRIAGEQEQLAALQAQVDADTKRAAQANADVQAAQERSEPLLAPAGLTALSGPGLVVSLNDAPDLGSASDDADLNALVVHQSDVQAVVNALWAGGAEAMSIMDQRIVATSSVRCVGNTLLLGGQVYSPPFLIRAIGPSDPMRSALNRSPGVLLFAQAAKYLGLGYTVAAQRSLTVPAYAGPVRLSFAEVPAQ